MEKKQKTKKMQLSYLRDSKRKKVALGMSEEPK